MGDHRDASLIAALDDASSDGVVVEGAQRDLNGGDVDELERLVQLPSIDVGHADAFHEALAEESGQGAHGGLPRRPRIGSVDEVEVDRQAVQGGEARFAVGENRSRATVRDPSAAGSCHAALRDDVRTPHRATAMQRTRDESLVVSELSGSVPVRVSGVEHRHTGAGCRRDRLERELLVAAVVGRHAHAPETDAKLGGVQPSMAIQHAKGTRSAAEQRARLHAAHPGHDHRRRDPLTKP